MLDVIKSLAAFGIDAIEVQVFNKMQHNQYYVIASAVKNAKKKKTTVPKKPLFITQIH